MIKKVFCFVLALLLSALLCSCSKNPNDISLLSDNSSPEMVLETAVKAYAKIRFPEKSIDYYSENINSYIDAYYNSSYAWTWSVDYSKDDLVREINEDMPDKDSLEVYFYVDATVSIKSMEPVLGQDYNEEISKLSGQCDVSDITQVKKVIADTVIYFGDETQKAEAIEYYVAEKNAKWYVLSDLIYLFNIPVSNSTLNGDITSIAYGATEAETEPPTEDNEKKQYVVTYRNNDESVFEQFFIPEGDPIRFPEEEPTYEDEYYDYIFVRWDTDLPGLDIDSLNTSVVIYPIFEPKRKD